jgi:DNA-binding transcriptional ArsR family regulator
LSIPKGTINGPFKLKLLYHLVIGPRTPTELALLENKHLSDISRGLRRLRKEGLVEYHNSGSRERYYKATVEGYVLLYASLRQGR